MKTTHWDRTAGHAAQALRDAAQAVEEGVNPYRVAEILAELESTATPWAPASAGDQAGREWTQKLLTGGRIAQRLLSVGLVEPAVRILYEFADAYAVDRLLAESY